MAKANLTSKAVDALRRKVGMHRVGPGLYLRVSSPTSATWMLRYSRTAGGKTKTTEMSLGSIDTMGLAEATAKAAEWRKRRKIEGIDPLTVKSNGQNAGDTFKAVAEALIAAKRAGWKNSKHAQQWENTLSTYVYPKLGNMNVAAVDTEAVLAVLNPIWSEKPETASRLRGRIEAVLDAAKVRGLRSGDNPAAWKGHLSSLLATISKGDRVKHHPALPYDQLPGFMSELRAKSSISARALEFTILTNPRTGATIGATWSEIDLDKALWSIPASRMKAKREHVIPLSSAAVELLRSLPRSDDTDLVFFTARSGKPKALSNMAMLEMLRGMRPGFTVHGFRSTFRDWAGETTSHPREVVEHAMAHQLPDKAEAAYARGTLLQRRVILMTDWAIYCAGK